MDGGRPFIVEVIVFDASVGFSAGLSISQPLSLELNGQILFFFYRQLLAMTIHNFMTTVLSKNVLKWRQYRVPHCGRCAVAVPETKREGGREIERAKSGGRALEL